MIRSIPGQIAISSIIVALSFTLSDSAFSGEHLRSIADVQINASLAAIDRAIRESRTDEEGSSDLLQQLQERRDAIIAEAPALRASPYNPLGNQPPSISFVVKGASTFAFGATGALLKVKDNTRVAHCSGTMIGCETFLTARHCVEDDPDEQKYFVYLQSEGIIGVEKILPEHPEYNQPYADLQLLKLSKAITAVRPAPLGSLEVPAYGMQATVVGFGHSSLNANDHGIKRFGSLTTEKCLDISRGGSLESTDGFICWLYDYKQSTTCHIDSGGPLFPGIVTDDTGIVGVTSGGDASCLDDAQNIDVDVQFFRPWPSETGGEDVGRLSCDPDGVGSIELVAVRAEEDPVSDLPKTYNVALEPGVQEVRISLNAEDRQENDLDLLVVRSDDGDSTDSCSVSDPGNFAFCSFDVDALSTNLSVTVSQKANGSGRYQLLVSQLSYNVFVEESAESAPPVQSP